MSRSKSPLANIEIRVILARAEADAMLVASRAIPGCKRPHLGSVAHYLREAALEKLGTPVIGCTTEKPKKDVSDYLPW